MSDYFAWMGAMLAGLESYGPEATEALRYIERHGTKLSVHEQPTGARWTIDRRIEIHPRYATQPAEARAVSLIIHEVRHLQQGLLTALSVYGELEAWQLQFRFLKKTLGTYDSQADREAIIGQLVAEPLGWNRQVLERARGLMQAYAGKGYRVDLLPLFPLPREILFRLAGRVPRS
jgi:hypothetical protein